MSGCDAAFAEGSSGLAQALRAVDCLTGELTTTAFARLFGAEGALTPVLTILLTLYIAFFALALLTGRASLGVSSLAPRMMMLGLALTFATSWLAYQEVVWNLTVGGPDWITGVITGSEGSATQTFAQRIDIVFAAIQQSSEAVAGAERPGGSAITSPGTMMWLAGLMFMLGTVGLLVTAKISLAVLLMLGPVFIVMAIFGATRGLFVGWLRAACVAAIVPMIAVLSGSFMLRLIIPVLSASRSGLAEGGGMIAGDGGAIPLFMLASVHMALMYVVVNTAMTMVSSWTVFGMAPARHRGGHSGSRRETATQTIVAEAAMDASGRQVFESRSHTSSAVISQAIGQFNHEATTPATSRGGIVVQLPDQTPAHRAGPGRARGIGSHFRTPTHQSRRLSSGVSR